MRYAVYVKYEDEDGKEKWGGKQYSGQTVQEAEKKAFATIKKNFPERKILKVISFKCEEDTDFKSIESADDELNPQRLKRFIVDVAFVAGIIVAGVAFPTSLLLLLREFGLF